MDDPGEIEDICKEISSEPPTVLIEVENQGAGKRAKLKILELLNGEYEDEDEDDEIEHDDDIEAEAEDEEEAEADDEEDYEEDDEDEEEVVINKEDYVMFKPRGARIASEFVVLTSNKTKSTCTVKNVDTNKKYSNVPWDKLELC